MHTGTESVNTGLAEAEVKSVTGYITPLAGGVQEINQR